MKITWTKGTDPALSKEIASNFKNSVQLRKRMITIINDKIDTVRVKARGEQLYDSPNWPYIQAGLLERERAYLEIISLLED